MQVHVAKLNKEIAYIQIAQDKCLVDELPPASLIGDFSTVNFLLPVSWLVYVGILRIPDGQSSAPTAVTMTTTTTPTTHYIAFTNWATLPPQPHARLQGRHVDSHDLTRKVLVEASEFDGRFDPGAFLNWLVAIEDFEWYRMDDAQHIRFTKMKLVNFAHWYCHTVVQTLPVWVNL